MALDRDDILQPDHPQPLSYPRPLFLFLRAVFRWPFEHMILGVLAWACYAVRHPARWSASPFGSGEFWLLLVLSFVAAIICRMVRLFSRSPRGRLISLSVYRPDLSLAVRRLCGVALQSGDGALRAPDATVQIDDIALRLDPRNRATLEAESRNFDKIIVALNGHPARMRFTDMRSPEEWKLNTDLHRLTLALLDGILGRHAPWIVHSGSRIKIRLPALIARAIEQCLHNQDRVCMTHPLGHARRWVGCQSFDNTNTEYMSRRETFCRALFGHDAMASIRHIAEPAIASTPNPLPCKTCSSKKASRCQGVVMNSVKQALAVHDYFPASVYEHSTLYNPVIYWPSGQRNATVQAVLDEASLEVARVVDPRRDPDVMDCCRVLFWSRDRVSSPRSGELIAMWDQILKMPVFWIDPTNGLAGQAALKAYFVDANHDYALVQNVMTPDTIAFKTTIRPQAPLQSLPLVVGSAEFVQLTERWEQLLGYMATAPQKKGLHERILLAPCATRQHAQK